MTRVFITGGAVHTYLDAVKTVTNRFKGGRMAALADFLSRQPQIEVTYLTANGMAEPLDAKRVLHHDGFGEYMDIVLREAKKHDVVILGAAVANLIPDQTLRKAGQKFPSHDYAVGDKISIEFEIAPRVIDMVKRENKRVTLIGYKLLGDVSREELIHAARGIVNSSGSAVVFGNRVPELDIKDVVTKEGGVVRLVGEPQYNEFVRELCMDEYYTTEAQTGEDHRKEWDGLGDLQKAALGYFMNYTVNNRDLLMGGKDEERGIILGCVAAKVPASDAFFISPRGKTDPDQFTFVNSVRHEDRVVVVPEDEDSMKASLNAPLIDSIFRHSQDIIGVVHWHEEDGPGTSIVYPYAPPGTVRDSWRPDLLLAISTGLDTFTIQGHGHFTLVRV